MSEQWKQLIGMFIFAASSAVVWGCGSSTTPEPSPVLDYQPLPPAAAKVLIKDLPNIRKRMEDVFPWATDEDFDEFFGGLKDALESPDGSAIMEPPERPPLS